jgi:hypothetical protein
VQAGFTPSRWRLASCLLGVSVALTPVVPTAANARAEAHQGENGDAGDAAKPTDGDGSARTSPTESSQQRESEGRAGSRDRGHPDATGKRRASKNDPDSQDDPGKLPRDPDDAPFMDAPNGQLRTFHTDPSPVTPNYSKQRRFQVSVQPMYADFRTRPFVGRPAGPIRGGGIGIEFDIRIVHWLWARAIASHTVHPVRERTSWDAEEETLLVDANAGQFRTTHLGGGIAYALDLGRFLPLVDAGGGVLLIASPDGAQPGQLGGDCLEETYCDIGLSCSDEQVCEVSPVPEVHAGIGMDVLLADHWTLGVHVRYHALLSDPANFPVYLTAALRLAFRF